jgi:hypothetical protein
MPSFETRRTDKKSSLQEKGGGGQKGYFLTGNLVTRISDKLLITNRVN